MTKEDFFDMFNRVHNPDYYDAKKKNKTKSKFATSRRKRHSLSKGKGGVDRLRKRFRMGKRERVRQDETS